jgi:hypothetical protein
MVDNEKNTPSEEPSYHYSREARVRRVHRDLYPETRKRRWIHKKRTRGLFVILIDLFLIAVVFYFISKPANIFLEKEAEGAVYQLNITGIRGKKILVGFTVENSGENRMPFPEAVPVTVRISREEYETVIIRKNIEPAITLDPGESSSVIFLLDEDNLPNSATLELFYGDSASPLFSKHVRF